MVEFTDFIQACLQALFKDQYKLLSLIKINAPSDYINKASNKNKAIWPELWAINKYYIAF